MTTAASNKHLIPIQHISLHPYSTSDLHHDLQALFKGIIAYNPSYSGGKDQRIVRRVS
jgi:hypothetical protein